MPNRTWHGTRAHLSIRIPSLASIASWCEDEKLAQDGGVEHRVLKAGVHRLRVSDGESEALDLFGVPLTGIVTARSSVPRLSGRSTVRVRTQRTQAAINSQGVVLGVADRFHDPPVTNR
jgi:hypothetical protein